MDGVVKWFSEEKGYGFITDENNKDHYFHVSDVKGALLPEQGNVIIFDVKITAKGSRAKNITILNGSASSDNRLDFCNHCNRNIVPRMITYQGEPQKTVCPYCARTIKNFDENMNLFDLAIGSFTFILSLISSIFEFIGWIFGIITNKAKDK